MKKSLKDASLASLGLVDYILKLQVVQCVAYVYARSFHSFRSSLLNRISKKIGATAAATRARLKKNGRKNMKYRLRKRKCEL